MASEKLNGYTLTKAWFNYTFEHPEKFNPTDGYLYLFLIEVANRSGWSEKFDVSAKDIMQALGIGTYNTYRKSFDKLVDDGWITVIKKSTNQFQKTIIALSKNNTATNGALDRALYQACNEACDAADAPIYKTINNKPKIISAKAPKTKVLEMPNDVDPELWEKYLKVNEWIKVNTPNILKMQDQLTVYEYQKLASKMHPTELASLLTRMHNWKDLSKKNVSVYLTANNWVAREQKQQKEKETIKRDHLGRDISRMG